MTEIRQPTKIALYHGNKLSGKHEYPLDMIADRFGYWRAANPLLAEHYGREYLLREFLSRPADRGGMNVSWGEEREGRHIDGPEYEALEDYIREATFCRHCGALMYLAAQQYGEPVWRTLYKNSVDPGQCFMRDGQAVEPINDGHEAATLV